MRKVSFFDMILVTWANMFFTPIIVKLFPQIMNVTIWWFAVLFVLCVIISFYVLRMKNECESRVVPCFVHTLLCKAILCVLD